MDERLFAIEIRVEGTCIFSSVALIPAENDDVYEGFSQVPECAQEDVVGTAVIREFKFSSVSPVSESNGTGASLTSRNT